MRIASLALAAGALVASFISAAQLAPAPREALVSGTAIGSSPQQVRAKYGGACVWDGSVGNWSNAAKWSCGAVPTSNEEARIGSGTVTLDTSAATLSLRISDGTLLVPAPASLSGPLTQTGGTILVTEDGRLRFPRGDLYRQEGGTLELRFAGLTRFGRLDQSNGIGGLGLFGLAGTLRLVGAAGYVPGDSDEFLVVNGSSLSAQGSGWTPTVERVAFPSHFEPVLGLFSGVVRNAFPGACRWDGSTAPWEGAARWSCGRVPAAGDTAIVESGAASLGADATVGRLVLRGGEITSIPGVTLTALGTPQPNLFAGNAGLASGLTLALRGTSHIANEAFIRIQGTIANEGSLSLEERAGQGTARSAVFSATGGNGLVVNRGTLRFDSTANVLLLGQVTLRNEGELTLESPDRNSPMGLVLDSGAKVVQAAGSILLVDATISANDATSDVEVTGGELLGEGRIGAVLRNTGGAVRPGLPCPSGGEAARAPSAREAKAVSNSTCSTPGLMMVNEYRQGPGGTLELQVAGDDTGDLDELSIDGPVSLAGRLEVRRLGGFTPRGAITLINAAGERSGAFDTIDNDFAPAFTVEHTNFGARLVPTTEPPPPPPSVPPTISSAAPGNGRFGTPYSHTFTAAGTPAPVFVVTAGQLPPGLTLTLQGLLSGTPTATGAFTATVSATNAVPPDDTMNFTISIAGGIPASIAAVSGGGQSAVINAEFSQPLVARVRDAGGNPVAGVEVVFRGPATFASASFTPPSVTTNAAGEAATVGRAIEAAGSYTASASVDGVEATADFALRNLALPQPATLALQFDSAIRYGSPITFDISARDAATNAPLAGGTVTIRASGTVVCTATLPATSCTPAAPIEPATHPLAASLEASGYLPAGFSSTLLVQKRPPTLTLTAPGSAKVGVPFATRTRLVTLRETDLVLPGTAFASGTLSLVRGTTVLCSVPVTTDDTVLDCPITPASLDSIDLVARYDGDARYEARDSTPQRVIVNLNEGFETGDVVPDFDAFDRDGNPVRLRDYAGKYVMLDFCAVWCRPCQEMGYKNHRVKQSFAGQPFEYVTVIVQDANFGPSTRADAQEWYSEHPIFAPVLHRNGVADPTESSALMRFFRALQAVDTFPSLILVDPQQRVLARVNNAADFTPARQVEIIAQGMGIATPALAPALRTSGISQARLFASQGAQPLVNLAIARSDPPGGTLTFAASGTKATLEQATINREPYDEPVAVRLTRTTPFTNAPLTVRLDGLGWPDLQARNFVAGSVLLRVNDNNFVARIADPALGENSLTWSIALRSFTFDPPLPAGTPITDVIIEFELDVDFGRASIIPPLEPPPVTRFTLAVAPAGAGAGRVLSTPAAIDCGTTCSASLEEGTAIALSATPAAGSVFAGWSGACTGTAACSLTMGGARSVTATFDLIPPPPPQRFTLTVARTGTGSGRVVSTPAAIDCGTLCSAAFDATATVGLAAQPASGSKFTGWSGACSGTGSCTVAMNAERSVQAAFAPDVPERAPPVFTSSAAPNAVAGVSYRHAFTASGATPLTFTLSTGSLPPGLSLFPTGILVGVPTTVGRFAGEVRAANGTAPDALQKFSITVAPGAAAILAIAGGNHQVGFLDPRLISTEPYPLPLAVRLTDAVGNGVAGHRVEFTPLALVDSERSGGGPTATLVASSALTDSSGRAQVTAIPAGGRGTFQVRARVEGFEPVVFDLANLAFNVTRPFRLNDTRARPALQRAAIHAPFEATLKVVAIDGSGRGAIPGVEVRFFAPEDAATGKPTAILEGGTAGRLGTGETARADETYRNYRSVTTDNSGEAEIRAIASGKAGAYRVKAVLVQEGLPIDPLALGGSSRLVDFELENLASGITLVLSRGADNQRADAGLRFPAELQVQAFTGNARDGTIANAELWFFAGDDALGVPGAALVGANAVDGVLASGQRYVAAVTNSNGIAGLTAVANRFAGSHRVIVAYPGDYAKVEQAPIQERFDLTNTSGLPRDGILRRGNPGSAIAVATGNFQVASSDGKVPFTHPLAARVTDAAGRAVRDALVRFVPLTRADENRGSARATVRLSDSLAATDALGIARVTATALGAEGVVKVRASVDGVEAAAEFTLTIDDSSALGPFTLDGFETGGRGSAFDILGNNQRQVVLARFDEPLLAVASSNRRFAAPGREVRYFVPETVAEGKLIAGFEPEGPAAQTWTGKSGKALRYFSATTGSDGIAELRGLANPRAGAYEIVAMLVDPGPADLNDPFDKQVRDAGRVVTYRLENVEAGAEIEVVDGHEQSQVTGQRFAQPLKVRVAPATRGPTRATARDHPRGGAFLDGAEAWFITPVLADDKTPGATLVGGEDSRLAADGRGNAWRATAVPIDDDGFASVTAIANGVQGGHRVFVAYPGDFDDPAKVPGAVSIFLCNTDSARTPCKDPLEEPAAITLLDSPEQVVFTPAAPPMRFVVKNPAGTPLANIEVVLVADADGLVTVANGWREQAGGARRTMTTDASGIVDAADGLSVPRGPTTATVTATVQGIGSKPSYRFTRYEVPTSIVAASASSSSAVVGAQHAAVSVRIAPPAPVRWTIVPGPGGAGGTFANGATSLTVSPSGATPSDSRLVEARVTANGVAGPFTLRAQAVGATLPPVSFPFFNIAAAPASVGAVESPLITYSGGLAATPRVLVRDASGAPLAGVPVTFTAVGAFDTGGANAWPRVDARLVKSVVTGADGVADAGTGLSVRDTGEHEIRAAVEGIANPAIIRAFRYNLGTISASGVTQSAAAVSTSHASLAVALQTIMPVRWTIVPGANGASGTFVDGTTTQDSIPTPRTGAGLPSSRVVRANAVAGTFTLRAELIGVSSTPVTFTLVNLASAPATVTPVQTPLITYSGGLRDTPRALVRNAAGAPLAGVPVTFTPVGAFDTGGADAWPRVDGRLVKTVVTGADGMADAGTGLSVRDTGEHEIRAAVEGIANPAVIRAFRYNFGTIAASGATQSAAAVGTNHASLEVTLQTIMPVRWTIVPGANGAGGTFVDGTTTQDSIPTPRTGAGVPSSRVVRANAIAGTFTLRAELIGTANGSVTFTLVNLATAPATVAPVQSPLITYSGGLRDTPRAIVRDAAGAPLAGVPVTFTPVGAFDTGGADAWPRVDGRLVKTVVTGADGVADAGTGLSVRDTGEHEVRAAVEGIANPAVIRVFRYNFSTITASGATQSSAPVGTNHASLTVALQTVMPVRWTIVPGANGASGTFTDGTTTQDSIPAPRTGAGVPSSRVVRANGIAGTFTLRAELIGTANGSVTFTLVNLGSAPQ